MNTTKTTTSRKGAAAKPRQKGREQSARGAEKKLWGGSRLDPRVEHFTVGNDFLLDVRLVPYDCVASMAHARMLGSIGILDEGEVAALVGGLEEVLALAREGRFAIRPDQEDCHTAIEQYLAERVGPPGKKIHTGRSRNDQVLTALRLYYRDALESMRRDVATLAASFRRLARRERGTPMPGYTHMRKAMPSSVALWASAQADALKDDDLLLRTALRLVDQCPLGSGAGYGVPLPLDRGMTASELGFAKVQENPIYVQLSRAKFEGAMVHALAQVMLDLNRAAADLVLFSMPEFGYFQLPPEMCTGSSIMPQKQNPDVLELVRARYHLVRACESQLMGTVANMPHGYHRDLQLTKEPTFRAIDATGETVHIMALVVTSLRVDRKACKAALSSELYAAERAYRLVLDEGIPFRDAYLRVKEELQLP